MQITVWFLFFGKVFQIQRQYLWLYLCIKLDHNMRGCNAYMLYRKSNYASTGR